MFGLFGNTPPIEGNTRERIEQRQHDEQVKQEAISGFMDMMLSAMAESADEKVKAKIALVRKHSEISKSARAVAMYAVDRSGAVDLETLKAAAACIESANSILSSFLAEHPLPENAISE